MHSETKIEPGTTAVAMSGGVDSSVAAALLKKQGYRVTGVFMRCYNLDGCAEHDAEDARRVAEHLGIPFYVLDLEEEYKKEVMDYMIRGYRRGLTPNPDVMCNKEIKFGLFLKRARALGAEGIATGHYVRLKKMRNGAALYAAKDANKDQSYFLWTLTQDQLKFCHFPLGGYVKPQVRGIARKLGLPTAEKRDSQGICFLGRITLRDFLADYIPERRGEVVTTEGRKIGEHRGVWFYTVGQRHIGVSNGGAVAPLYVAAKKMRANKLVVAEGGEHEALFRKEIRLAEANMIRQPLAISEKKQVFARVRYRQPLGKAVLTRTRRGYLLTFAVPQKFIAEGQSAVLYAKDGEMFGGGVIV